MLNAVAKPEWWATIRAGGSGETNWLSTSALPTVAPNTGMFFNPNYQFNMGALNPSTGVGWNCEEEVEVEFRGTKI